MKLESSTTLRPGSHSPCFRRLVSEIPDSCQPQPRPSTHEACSGAPLPQSYGRGSASPSLLSSLPTPSLSCSPSPPLRTRGARTLWHPPLLLLAPSPSLPPPWTHGARTRPCPSHTPTTSAPPSHPATAHLRTLPLPRAHSTHMQLRSPSSRRGLQCARPAPVRRLASLADGIREGGPGDLSTLHGQGTTCPLRLICSYRDRWNSSR